MTEEIVDLFRKRYKETERSYEKSSTTETVHPKNCFQEAHLKIKQNRWTTIHLGTATSKEVITPNWTYIQHRTAPQSHHYQQQVCDRLVVLLGPRARKAEYRHVRAESSSPIHRTSWVVVVVFFNCLPTSSSKPRDKAAQQCHHPWDIPRERNDDEKPEGNTS